MQPTYIETFTVLGMELTTFKTIEVLHGDMLDAEVGKMLAQFCYRTLI